MVRPAKYTYTAFQNYHQMSVWKLVLYSVEDFRTGRKRRVTEIWEYTCITHSL